MRSLFFLLALVGCANPKVIDGQYKEPYGLINKAEVRDPCANYEVSTGNLFISVVTAPTAVYPLYTGAVALYEPVSSAATSRACRLHKNEQRR